MKKQKIAKLVAVFVLLLMCSTSLLGCAKQNTSSQNVTKKLANTTGAWLWQKSVDDKYVDFAIQNGVDEIYYSCGYKFDGVDANFMQRAKDGGIKVFFLCGEKEWIDDSTDLDAIVKKYLAYNASNQQTQFAGIHFDVEPQQFDDFQANRTAYLQKYIDFVHSTSIKYANINLDFDIPAWFNDEIEYDGKTKQAFKFVTDFASRIFVMSYRDSAEKIFATGKDEFEYASQVGKAMFFGVETNYTDEGDNISFFEEGKTYFESEIQNLKALVGENFNLSVHHLKSWFDLPTDSRE